MVTMRRVDASFVLDMYSRAHASHNLVNNLSRAVGTCPDLMRYHLKHDKSTISPIGKALDVIHEEGFGDPSTVPYLMFSTGCAFEHQQNQSANERVKEMWDRA